MKNLISKLQRKPLLLFLVSLCMFLFVWIVPFLAFYPGIYAYDASWQYAMYLTDTVSTHHPILHTYILGIIMDTVQTATGSINKAVAAYTLFQVLVMALGSAFVIYELARRKLPSWTRIFAFLFLAFYPPYVIFVFTSTKDSIFAIAVADLILLMLSMLDDAKSFFEKTNNKVLFVVFALEVCILRNNAIYAVLVALPFLIVFLVKSNCDKKKAFLTLGITALIFIIYKYPVTNALIDEESSKAELLSVPCQQIMRVYKYHYDELTPEDRALVEKYFDSEAWYGYYVPEIADATKGSLRMELLEEDASEFVSLWKLFLKKYPGEYVGSFLDNTNAFWNPWPHYVIYSFGGEGYTPILCMQPAEQNSKLPKVLAFYKNFENGDLVQKWWPVSWLFAPATFFYLMLAMMVISIRKKGISYGLPFLFLLLLWGTYLLGPAAMVRYALYLYVLVPVWPAYIMKKSS